MEENGKARRRRPRASDPSASDGTGQAPSRSPSPEKLKSQALRPVQRYAPSIKFVVRWTARVLLVVCLILSSAKVVRISDHSAPAFDDAESQPSPTVLLVIAHSRPKYLERCLASILQHRQRAAEDRRWSLVVSIDTQDGLSHEDVVSVARDAGVTFDGKLSVWRHDVFYPAAAEVADVDEGTIMADVDAYRRISRHYKWALARAFTAFDAERVVVVEDDLEVAPDFFDYFDALSPILDRDPTLFCVSAWNDNGKPHLSLDSQQFHRTDFFPGLGWMLTRSFWEEVEPMWPDSYWDDFLRSPAVTRGRQCIRPEVSRTANYGERGVSQSYNYEKHIAKVKLNQVPVNMTSLDLGYLDPVAYEKLIFGRLSNSVLLKYSNYLTSKPQDSDVTARHPSSSMEQIGKRTGVMTDHREGVFRTSYRGVVVIPWNGHWAFLIPRDWVPPEGHTTGSRVCCN